MCTASTIRVFDALTGLPETLKTPDTCAKILQCSVSYDSTVLKEKWKRTYKIKKNYQVSLWKQIS